MTNKEKGLICRKRHPLKWKMQALYMFAQRRVHGLTGHPRGYIWIGLPLCSKAEFKQWFISQLPKIVPMFRTYLRKKKDRKFALSLNRKNRFLGYTIDNLEILTVSDNSRLARSLKKPRGA